jgi:hypothetical protein
MAADTLSLDQALKTRTASPIGPAAPYRPKKIAPMAGAIERDLLEEAAIVVSVHIKRSCLAQQTLLTLISHGYPAMAETTAKAPRNH